MNASAQDLLILVGLGLSGLGLALFSVPLALTVVGALMLTGGIWARVQRAKVTR